MCPIPAPDLFFIITTSIFYFLSRNIMAISGDRTSWSPYCYSSYQNVGILNKNIFPYHSLTHTRYVRKVMRPILLGQAEGSGSGVSRPDGWWGMSGKRSDPAQLPLSLYRVRIACEVDSCLSVVSRVKMQRSVDQRYAIKFCVKLEKSTVETLAMI